MAYTFPSEVYDPDNGKLLAKVVGSNIFDAETGRVLSMRSDTPAGSIDERVRLLVDKMNPSVPIEQRGTTYPSTYLPLNSINSANIAPSSDLSKQVSYPANTPAFDVNALITQTKAMLAQTAKEGSKPYYGSAVATEVPEYPLTPQQTKIQKMIEDIQARISEGAGKSAYQSSLESQQRIPDLTQLVNDLSGQLRLSQVEAANISATPQTGVGVTSAIDARQRAESLRLNSVKSLQISAQLEMAKGNLQTAQDIVDKMVSQKYGAIEANIEAAKTNLQLFENSPEYQNEVQYQKDLLNAKQDKIDESKTITKQIMDILNDPDFQLNAPVSVKKQLSDLALKTDLTQADAVNAANIGTRYKVSPKITPVGNKLTLNEAKSLGLPTSLIGMTEEEIGNQLASDIPQDWFREIKEQELQSSITPEKLKELWNEFRNLILSKAKITTTEEITNPFQ